MSIVALPPALFLLALGLVPPSVGAESPEPARSSVPGAPELDDAVRLEDRLGERAELGIRLTDRFGKPVVLAELLANDKPTVLVLAYYRCPMLCGLTLRGVARGLAGLVWTPGDEYDVVTVSFDPRDRPPAADRARASVLDELGGDLADDAWPFLVGDELEVRKLTDSLGFYYAYDERTRQYAHPSGIFVLTPTGNLSQVLQGFEFAPLDLRMALVEAGEGKTGSFAEQVLLTCFRYDPAKRRYGPYVVGFLRLGAGAVLVMMGLGYLILLRRGRRRSRKETP